MKRDNQILIATHNGELEFGTLKITCAVLEDGTAVLSERSVANAFGVKGSGAYWQRKKQEIGASIPEYLSARYLQNFISTELREKLTNSISYIAKSGTKASGLPADILPDICDVWIKADQKGALKPKQKSIAERAYILLRGFANVGITALVYEATGYDKFLSRKHLHEILEKFIAKELRAWTKRFPNEFYEYLFKLRGWQYTPFNPKRPAYVGKLTNDLVYERLAPGVLNELREKNPPTSKGYRKHKHHQWLSEDIGDPKLRAHLDSVITLMKVAPNWRKFYDMLNRGKPKYNETIEMLLEFEVEENL